jgi:hypothetical protein
MFEDSSVGLRQINPVYEYCQDRFCTNRGGCVNKCVLQAGAEKKVTFDWGPAGSKAEDCFFGIMALDQGYSFNFIQVGIRDSRLSVHSQLLWIRAVLWIRNDFFEKFIPDPKQDHDPTFQLVSDRVSDPH